VRRIALQRELAEVAAELNGLHAAAQPIQKKLREREREIKAAMAQLDGEAEGGAK
jgi:hypothetical protein